ncbi:MAG: CHAT domain-containing protein [Ardenticatenaceae bacterium]
MKDEIRGTFTIIIKRQGDEYTIEADGPSGIRVAPKRLRPLEAWLSSEHRETIGWLRAESVPVGQSEGFSERLVELGKRLYEVLFDRSGLGVPFGRAMGSDGGIRLCLQVEPPELAELPWETMYDEGMSEGSPWLATRTSMPLIRRLPPADSGPVPGKLMVQGPLRILFVGASPDGLVKLSVAKIADELQDKLKEAIEQGQIVLDIVLNGSVEDLREKLLPNEHHILFFAGHGGTNQLCFDDGQGDDNVVEGHVQRQAGDPYWLTAPDLARELDGKSRLRLLFLAACRVPPAQASAAGAPKSFAHHLWDVLNLPAIVAMQSFVSDKQANALSIGFFNALAAFQPVDVALNHARKALIHRNSMVGRDVFTAVLFMRAPEGRLFERVAPQDQLATLRPADGKPPYKGLRHFEEEDADRFFGRERLTDELVDLLLEQRFLAVVGASGSGKSSLLRAGIVPAFKRGQASDPQDGDYWLVRVITPTNHPLETLAASLTEDVESVTATETLTQDLAQTPRSLHLYARKALSRTGRQRLLLVVDQFEELFTLCRDKNEQQAFVNNLLTATSPATDGPTLVVIALRADFYAHCAQFDDLRDALEGQQKYIGPMNEVELRQAIEKPAEQGKWRFESGLVELLLKEVGHEPGALPLLSHALDETWRRRSGRTLTFVGYHESGGVKKAIAQSADRLYQQLTSEEQAVARAIFLELTELGDGTPDTRRRILRSDLTERVHPGNKPLVERVINTLADARLLTVFKDSIEVAHEALIREWPRLHEWLSENREGMRVRRRLSEDAQKWEDLNRDTGALYRGLMLSQTLEWAETHHEQLNEKERIFIDRSKEWVEQERAEREARLQRELEQEQALRKAEQERTKEAEARQQAEQERAEEAEARRKAEQKRAEEAERREQEEARASSQLRGLAIGLAVMFVVALGIASYAYSKQVENTRLNLSFEGIRIGLEARDDSAKHPLRSLRLLIQASHMVKLEQPNIFDVKPILIEVLKKTPGITPSGQESPIEKVHISSDGNWLVTKGSDNQKSNDIDSRVLLWNLSTEKFPPISLTTNKNVIRLVDFSTDNRWLITASINKENGIQSTLKLWDLKSTDLYESYCQLKYQEEITDMIISPDNNSLLVASTNSTSDNGTVSIWSLSDRCSNKQAKSTLKSPINAMAISPNNQLLVTVSGSTTIDLWEFNLSKQPTLISNDLAIETVRFSPDNRWLIFNSGENIIIYNLNNKMTYPIPTKLNRLVPPVPVIISHDSRWLITASSDTTIRLWNLQADDPTKQEKDNPMILGDGDQVTAMNISSDSRLLVTGSPKGNAYLWDLNSDGNEPISLKGNHGYIQSMTISPKCKVKSSDKQWIAAGNKDGNIYLWDCNTILNQAKHQAHEPILLTGHEGSISNVIITSNNYLISTSQDGTVRWWNLNKLSQQKSLPNNLTLEELILLACRRAGRELTQIEWQQYFPGEPHRETCKNLPDHYMVLEEARKLARENKRNDAIAKFKEALALDPSLELEPESEVNREAAEGLVERGRRLAREGDIGAAIAMFEEALDLDSSLELEPESEAKRVAAESIVEQAYLLAIDGDIDASITVFEKALDLDSSLELEPETKRVVAEGLVKQGRIIAEEGHIDEAIAKFNEALDFYPEVELKAKDWNTLCWHGSLWGYAGEVMEVCERAVELDPHHGRIIDSRGLARALTGDYEGAIEDFEFYVEWSKENRGYEEYALKREGWIVELKAGRDPFDAKTLEALK